VPAIRARFVRPAERDRQRAPAVVAANGAAARARDGVVLAAEGLTKRFGAVAAADGVSFELAPAEVCALIGPNGSGKTTVLRLLAGTLKPDAGSVLLRGTNVTRENVRSRVLGGVVRTLQSTAAFAELTALENVLVGAGLRRQHGGTLRELTATPLARAEDAATRTAAQAALEDVGLGWASDVPAGQLAGPEQRLLGLAAALATRPRAVLLDEPSAGSSLDDLRRLSALIERIRSRGVAVLLVEHDLRLVRAVADRVVVLVAGAVIATGTPAEVAASADVRAAYLGRNVL